MAAEVRFDRFRFDVQSQRLWAEGAEVRLTPKAATVLALLVARGGEPVTKDELFASAWPDTAVSDDALTACIVELRRALGDDAKQARYIETRHRRGYRFAAETQPRHDEVVAGDADQTVGRADDAPPSDVASIAVLPLADMSPDRDHDYLCEGLAEELINALTHVDGLRVAARTASFRFRDIGADVSEIGRQLKVRFLLEGSVRKSDSRLRVTVQLIDVATGFHRWSQRFDRPLGDMFAIQDEIAASVVESLRGDVPSPSERQAMRRRRAEIGAFEYYLRGRQTLPRQTHDGHTNSVRMFERAIAIDASYAPAHAGLAMAHAALYEWFGSDDANRAAAEVASERALMLAPNLAESHVARGCACTIARRYAEAAVAFEAAIALNRSLFEAYYYYARSSFAAGEIARSADLFQRAAEVRSEDFQSPLLAGQSLAILGRHDEARAYGLEGIRRAERALELNPADTRALSLGAGHLVDLGDVDRGVEWCERALALNPNDMSTLINGACMFARLERKERALDLLETAFERRWGQLDWIAHDRDYDNLRDEPRFQRLLARLK